MGKQEKKFIPAEYKREQKIIKVYSFVYFQNIWQYVDGL